MYFSIYECWKNVSRNKITLHERLLCCLQKSNYIIASELLCLLLQVTQVFQVFQHRETGIQWVVESCSAGKHSSSEQTEENWQAVFCFAACIQWKRTLLGYYGLQWTISSILSIGSHSSSIFAVLLQFCQPYDCSRKFTRYFKLNCYWKFTSTKLLKLAFNCFSIKFDTLPKVLERGKPSTRGNIMGSLLWGGGILGGVVCLLRCK